MDGVNLLLGYASGFLPRADGIAIDGAVLAFTAAATVPAGLLFGSGPMLALGTVAALFLSRLMASMLYGVEATDPATFAAVLAILLVVAIGACLLPARRRRRSARWWRCGRIEGRGTIPLAGARSYDFEPR